MPLTALTIGDVVPSPPLSSHSFTHSVLFFRTSRCLRIVNLATTLYSDIRLSRCFRLIVGPSLFAPAIASFLLSLWELFFSKTNGSFFLLLFCISLSIKELEQVVHIVYYNSLWVVWCCAWIVVLQVFFWSLSFYSLSLYFFFLFLSSSFSNYTWN